MPDPTEDWLVSWLNGPPEVHRLGPVNDGRERIQMLLFHLQALSRELRLPWEKRTGESMRACRERQRKEHVHYAAVLNLTQRWSTWLEFVPRGRELKVYDRSIGYFGSEEARAYRVITRLVKQKLLDRLDKCAHCQVNWIFRWRKDRKFCSAKCRQNHYEATPRRKKAKREFMRGYYQNLMSVYRSAQSAAPHGRGKHGKR